VVVPLETENNLSNLSDLSENKNFTTEELSNKRVESGLDFILGHFQEPIWPRTVSTAATKKDNRGENVQYPVGYKDRAMLFYEGALRSDCRINAFRVGQTNPDILFIDLDLKDFKGRADLLKRALTNTLNTIAQRLDGARPTVIWSGNGYHIILPVNCPGAIEDMHPELRALEPETSKAYLKFAKRYLSNGKACGGNNPSLKSCMLRVPGSLNAKNGEAKEVKIIQRWNGKRPDYRLLLGVFHAHLLTTKKKAEEEEEALMKEENKASTNYYKVAAGTGANPWIEKLLQTPLEDYRKYIVDLILGPYLVVEKKLDEATAYSIIMEWLRKCHQSTDRPLLFNPYIRTRDKIRQAQKRQIRHISLKKLRQNNPELFDLLVKRGVVMVAEMVT
jgi:Primase X